MGLLLRLRLRKLTTTWPNAGELRPANRIITISDPGGLKPAMVLLLISWAAV
jgi:hypothetical protein